MRFPLARLAGAAAGVLIVLSCDGGPAQPRFGSGISGGPTGTAPVVPPDPSIPDTGNVFTQILIPSTNGAQVNIGDSILVRVRVTDDRNVAGLTIQGMKFSGVDSLGTLQETIRYTAIPMPAPGAVPLRSGITDTTVSRYLKPNVPVDSTLGDLIILAIGVDAAGNVDTARRVLQLVTGPAVNILGPLPGSEVAQGSSMTVRVHVTHNVGVRSVRTLVQGESTWPAPGLNAQFDTVFAGIVRDDTIDYLVPVPLNAPAGRPITITASAEDIQGNPGSTAPITVIVLARGTRPPKVTQLIEPRLETDDCIQITASGDDIVALGYTIFDDIADTLVAQVTVPLAPPFSGTPPPTCLFLNLPPVAQGLKVRISSFADDAAGLRGFSVPSISSLAQSNPALAHIDLSLIVFGRSYNLPRPGVLGDVAVDTVRSRVIISNLDANRLDIWENPTRVFDPVGVAVGSQPWGLAVALNKDTLLVANSGGTNVSRVYLGDPGGLVSGPGGMREDLTQRIRTRTNFMFVLTEGFDNGGFVHFGPVNVRMFSDRPQYIGQISDTTIYFSTKPTPTAPEGTVRYLDPRQPFPDLRTFVFVRDLATTIENFVIVDIDSVEFRRNPPGTADELFLFDHLPGTNLPSDFVRSPTCRDTVGRGEQFGKVTCDLPAANDPRFDPRFPEGIAQGVVAAAAALRLNRRDNAGSPLVTSPSNGCALFDPLENPVDAFGRFGKCSDVRVFEDVDPVGITDTTFVGTSADRRWIAFGEGNTSVGVLLMAAANPCAAACPTTLHPLRPLFPRFHSPIVTQFDLTNQASERIFGVAIDSTGRTVAAHGTQSYFSAVDEPFHLRLQGFYGDAGTGGAGIAYHPRADGITHADGTQGPAEERLGFIAAGDKTIHATDLAFFIRRGRYDLKHQLYGPLRVSRPLAGDNPPGTPAQDLVILKLYGISLAGGLTVIDLRAADILAVP
ncbi:MAG: hypothetical protein WD825_02280 [Gemmatimonadaceae bacterium]